MSKVGLASAVQDEAARQRALHAFHQHDSDCGNLDVLERCKRLNEFLSQDFLKPGAGGSNKAELQQILSLLGSKPKRPAFLDKPPVTHTVGKHAPSKPSASRPANAAAPSPAPCVNPCAAPALGDFDADRLLGALELEEDVSSSQGASTRPASSGHTNSSVGSNPSSASPTPAQAPEDVEDLIGLLNVDAQLIEQRQQQARERELAAQRAEEEDRARRQRAEQQAREQRQKEEHEQQAREQQAREQQRRQQEERERAIRLEREEAERQRRAQVQREEAEAHAAVQRAEAERVEAQRKREEQERQRMEAQRAREEEARRVRAEAEAQKRREEEERQRAEAQRRREEQEKQKQREAAAVCLQAAVRGARARAALRTLRRLREGAAARAIQAAWRRWAALPENVWKLGPVRAAAHAHCSQHASRAPPRPASAVPPTQPVWLRSPSDCRSAPTTDHTQIRPSDQAASSSEDGGRVVYTSGRHAQRTVSGAHARSHSVRRDEARQRGDVATRAVMAASEHRDAAAALEAARHGSLGRRD